ncbi:MULTISPECIES: immunity 52 family protein [unclassified Paraburkholderia]|uniref:immunity 52 family protein n=1 Tax=unclassified Paraburkholderia TaxID=2615204 RepID=UPI002AB08554|nr:MULTISPECIES: immunity 52 family protein [unclassified Paraburkholderia]
MNNQDEDILDIELKLTFRMKNSPMPTRDQQCEDVWRFAQSLERVGLEMNQWFVMGDPNATAFTNAGPSDFLVDSLSGEPDLSSSRTYIWNGREGKGGAGFGATYDLKWLSKFDFRADGFDCLRSYESVINLVDGALRIWPGLVVQVGPYAYSTREKVFPDRPGVGWMLYLPRALTPAQVPEAHALVPVIRDGQQQGTIIVSVKDEVFDVSNREHVKTANDIEIRLADQDLLPRYSDL